MTCNIIIQDLYTLQSDHHDESNNHVSPYNGETMETVTDFILGAPKSLQMVTAATKLKDACSLKEKKL